MDDLQHFAKGTLAIKIGEGGLHGFYVGLILIIVLLASPFHLFKRVAKGNISGSDPFESTGFCWHMELS
jgi:hypothetical protein